MLAYMVEHAASDKFSEPHTAEYGQKLLSATYEVISMIRLYGLPDEETADLYAKKIAAFYAFKKRLFSLFSAASKASD